MTLQSITETAPAVNPMPMTEPMTALLTERRNRKLHEEGQACFCSSRCSVWWVVLAFEGGDETRPSRSHWCFDEEHAEQEAARYREQGVLAHICATYAA